MSIMETTVVYGLPTLFTIFRVVLPIIGGVLLTVGLVILCAL